MLPDWFTFSWVVQQIVGAAVGEAGWLVAMSAASAIGLTTLLHQALGLLPTKRDMLWFGGMSFIISGLVFYAVTARPTSVPELHPDINFVAYGGEKPDERDKVPYAALGITNTGLPSIANGWIVEATSDGQKHTGDLQAVPDRMVLGLGADRITYVNSSLADRAANNPIATGGQVVGLLIVSFPKLDKDFFKGKTPLFEVKFKDVKQREYTATVRPTGERAKARHVPGMSEIRQPPQQAQQPQQPQSR
jgi:hypothetical protein